MLWQATYYEAAQLRRMADPWPNVVETFWRYRTIEQTAANLDRLRGWPRWKRKCDLARTAAQLAEFTRQQGRALSKPVWLQAPPGYQVGEDGSLSECKG